VRIDEGRHEVFFVYDILRSWKMKLAVLVSFLTTLGTIAIILRKIANKYLSIITIVFLFIYIAMASLILLKVHLLSKATLNIERSSAAQLNNQLNLPLPSKP
jgi:hypothetical protein